jgi:hypothetical protein
MESRRTTTTKDINEAYEKNIGFYIPGYGHVTNFKNFYDNELQGKLSMKKLAEGARTDPKFVESIDRLLNASIKSYNSGGINMSRPEEERVVIPQQQEQEEAVQPRRPTFAERFKTYRSIAEADALNLINEYREVSKQIEKDTPNRYGSFKETFAAERRRAIKEGILDSHTFEYTDPKTGNKGVYHARTVKEQANWLKKRREQDA